MSYRDYVEGAPLERGELVGYLTDGRTVAFRPTPMPMARISDLFTRENLLQEILDDRAELQRIECRLGISLTLSAPGPHSWPTAAEFGFEG